MADPDLDNVARGLWLAGWNSEVLSTERPADTPRAVYDSGLRALVVATCMNPSDPGRAFGAIEVDPELRPMVLGSRTDWQSVLEASLSSLQNERIVRTIKRYVDGI